MHDHEGGRLRDALLHADDLTAVLDDIAGAVDGTCHIGIRIAETCHGCAEAQRLFDQNSGSRQREACLLGIFRCVFFCLFGCGRIDRFDTGNIDACFFGSCLDLFFGAKQDRYGKTVFFDPDCGSGDSRVFAFRQHDPHRFACQFAFQFFNEIHILLPFLLMQKPYSQNVFYYV